MNEYTDALDTLRSSHSFDFTTLVDKWWNRYDQDPQGMWAKDGKIFWFVAYVDALGMCKAIHERI